MWNKKNRDGCAIPVFDFPLSLEIGFFCHGDSLFLDRSFLGGLFGRSFLSNGSLGGDYFLSSGSFLSGSFFGSGGFLGEVLFAAGALGHGGQSLLCTCDDLVAVGSDDVNSAGSSSKSGENFCNQIECFHENYLQLFF